MHQKMRVFNVRSVVVLWRGILRIVAVDIKLNCVAERELLSSKAIKSKNVLCAAVSVLLVRPHVLYVLCAMKYLHSDSYV